MSNSSVVSFDILIFVGSIITVLLAVIAILTISKSAVLKRRDRRDIKVRSSVRQTLLGRMEMEDPEWEEWVEGLSAPERRVATELLEEYLQRIRGSNAAVLQRLGYALGIGKKARCKLRDGDRFERRWALHWIARLDIDIDIETLQISSQGYPETKAAAARVLHEQGRPEAARAGTELLLQGSKPLSTLGVDTLYQLNKLSPEPLVSAVKSSYGEWDESRIIQVLQVIGEAGPSKPDTDLGWIGFLLLSESPKVRAAATQSLFGYGWHDDVRSAVDIGQVRTDESPQVRQAVYRMLGTWEGDASTNALLDAVRTESDPRAAIDAVTALGERAEQIPESELSTPSSAARDWVVASTYMNNEAAQ